MKFNITKYLDYREIVRVMAREKGLNFRSLAASAGMHTSYFSRVMSGDADFSAEQLYKVARDLGLRDWELDYIELLGDHSRSGASEHRAYLKGKIQKIRLERQKVFGGEDDIEVVDAEARLEKYYQDPLTQRIHLHLTIQKYRERPLLIGAKLGLTERRLEQEIGKLEEIGIVERSTGGDIKKVKFNIHLDENHPLIPQYHINWRLEVIRRIQSREKLPSDSHFSAVFSTDEEAKLRIKERFKQFVIEAQKEAAQVRSNEDVYSICFDMF